jgi:hypothetical protein
MEDDPDAWRKPWVYEEWKREQDERDKEREAEYARYYKQRLEENRQRRQAAQEARNTVWEKQIEALGFNGRNWAIWRRYKAGGVILKQVGDEFGIGPERVRQIIRRLDRKVKKALNHEWNNVPDEIREATLGVEFVFRNELAFTRWDGDTKGWEQVEPEKHGSVYFPPTPEWRTEWGEQDIKPAKPRPVYTYYKTVIREGADDD